VNKDTCVPFPVPIILKAMNELKYCVKENSSAKKQALLLIKELPKILPLERAKMKIKITCSNAEKADEVKLIIEDKYIASSETEETKETLAVLESENTLEDSTVDLVRISISLLNILIFELSISIILSQEQNNSKIQNLPK
jgi:ribosome maturation protein Sdo1